MTARAIHHVGVAVRALDEAVARYERLLGGSVEAREQVPEQGVSAALLRIGPSRLELLAPLADDTPVGRFLERRGPGMHHLAYAVDDIDAELARLRAAGAELVDEAPRTGIYGRVAFVHHESFDGVLTELVETEGA